MPKAANFCILRSLSVPGLDLVLRDLGPWDEHLTITTDAEGVVARVVASGDYTPGKRLFYEDSEGELTELLVENGKFLGFAFVYQKERP